MYVCMKKMKNKDEIYKELKSIKYLINERHPSCKVQSIYISAPILWLDSKNAVYVGKLKVVEENMANIENMSYCWGLQLY